ncbi:MAG: hypothetical protein FWG19_02670 [Methanomassiliicoccaceae archaeon]|nr:hypothetical protein [Methanomassiliicoccaceae archaeon]
MVAGKQKRVALFMCLFWAIAMATAYLISDRYGSDLNWYMVLFSLLFMMIGIITVFGRIRFFFPFTFFSKEDLHEYNVEKIGLVLGTPMVVLSCSVPFVTMSFSVFWVIVMIAAAMEVGGLYASAAERFKADTRSGE